MQPILDRYIAGDSDGSKISKWLTKHWNHKNYRLILDAAKAHGMKVVALDLDYDTRGIDLSFAQIDTISKLRNKSMASQMQRILRGGGRIIALVGALHASGSISQHLPDTKVEQIHFQYNK